MITLNCMYCEAEMTSPEFDNDDVITCKDCWC
jgi:hypothetical protein